MSSPAVDRADVVERAGGDQLVDGAGPGLHLRGLVLGALDGQPDVAHLLADAGHRLVDPGLRLGGGVGRLDRLLAGPEGLDLGLQPLLGEGELLLLALQLGVLGLEVGDLGGQRRLAGQRLAGEVLAAHLQRLLGLPLQLGGLLLELVDLQLDPLAAGRHVGDAAAHLREQVELALVAVVEGLARVLGAVQGLVGLGPEDQADALHETHAGGSLSVQSLVRLHGDLTLRPHGKAPVGSVATRSSETTHRAEGARVPSYQVRDRPLRSRPTKPGGKGRPTPTRKEAEAAARPRPRCRAPARSSRRGAARRQDRVQPAGARRA